MIEARPDGETLVDRATDAFRRYQDGDRAAFDTLVEVASPVMWRVARGAGLDQVTGEDVLQTVWMSALRSAGEIRDPRTIVKWLLTSTRREAWRVSKRSRADLQPLRRGVRRRQRGGHGDPRRPARTPPTSWSSATTGSAGSGCT